MHVMLVAASFGSKGINVSFRHNIDTILSKMKVIMILRYLATAKKQQRHKQVKISLSAFTMWTVQYVISPGIPNFLLA